MRSSFRAGRRLVVAVVLFLLCLGWFAPAASASQWCVWLAWNDLHIEQCIPAP